jgi:hypothetical protein
MRIYIAGKMRGIPHSNFPMFDAAEYHLTQAGWEVASPAAMNREHGIMGDRDLTPEELRFVFAEDTHAVCYSDAIALLPGWEDNSAGALVEFLLARILTGLEPMPAPKQELPV